MIQETQDNSVTVKINLASPPQAVFPLLATDHGRARFWAERTIQVDGVVDFRFSNGMQHRGQVLASDPPAYFSVEYFGGSRASFFLVDDGRGGTDLTLVETGIPTDWIAEHRAGWVSVLLCLKAAADFNIDLRNPDPEKSWDRGYADV